MENSPGSSIVEVNTLTPELMNQVFGIEHIRDKIFDYVFTSDNSNIFTCRLVEHSWLEYVTWYLRTSGHPRFELSFHWWRDFKAAQERRPREYQVQKFLDTWATCEDAGSRVPLFFMDFTRPWYETVEKCEVQDLIKVLTRCGNGLHSLKLNLLGALDMGLNDAINRLDVVGDMGQLNLPNLKDLEVCLEDTPLVSLLLPPILSGCERLTDLRLQVESPNRFQLARLVPEEQIEYLPHTLEKIESEVIMTSQLLTNLFLKNSLPNLTELRLNVRQNNDGINDVISRMMHRFSCQLKFFKVDCDYNSDVNATFIKFSVMTKLKEITISGFHSELVPGSKQTFPVLESLKLEWQSSTMMQKWTQHFQFSCVRDLNVQVYTGHYNNVDVDFTLELSQQLHVSFPYLQKLCLLVGGRVESSSVQNIFKHMTQLCELLIQIDKTDEIIEASTWDAILLGVSTEYARNLAESPRELLNPINFSHFWTRSCSIVNLSRLTRLELAAYSNRQRDNLLISDVSFTFAFLRMSSLVELGLFGRFKASEEMVQEWRTQGRQIEI